MKQSHNYTQSPYRTPRPKISRARFVVEARDVLQSSRPLQRKVGDICRLARLHQGQVISEVAQMVGRSTTYVQQLEVGNKPMQASAPILIKLGVDHQRLMGLLVGPPPDADAVESLLIQRSDNGESPSALPDEVATK